MQWREFLDSLEPEKGLPEEMHGWRFDEPLEIVCNGRDRISVENFTAYILERCRRAEGQAEAMTGFLQNACEWPFTWRIRLAWGILTRRYAAKISAAKK